MVGMDFFPSICVFLHYFQGFTLLVRFDFLSMIIYYNTVHH
jgi:hypothetical protein